MLKQERIEYEIENMKKCFPDFTYRKVILGRSRFHDWIGEVKVGKGTYGLAIRLSKAYPNSRPYVVYLKNKNVQFDSGLISSHIGANNDVCLYTSDGGENDWHRDYTVVDVIKRFELFLTLHTKGKVKNLHKTIKDKFIDYTNDTKYVVNSNWYPTTGQKGFIKFLYNTNNRKFYSAHEININHKGLNQIVKVRNNYIDIEDKAVLAEKISWIYLKRVTLQQIYKLKSKKSFLGFIKSKKSASSFLDMSNLEQKYIIYTGGDNSKILVDLTYGFSLSNIISINKSMFFSRNRGLVEDTIQNNTVGIFGLGSLGSKVAEQLCRSGVEKFILFDYDQFCPENLSRHILTTGDLFLNKAEAVRTRLHRINPGVDIKTVNKNIFNNDESYISNLELLSNLDFIICTTGDEESEYELNLALHLIDKKSIPCLYSAILGNGFGGRIHKVIKGSTPCYNCIKQIQENKPTTFKLYSEKPFLSDKDTEYGIYSEPGLLGLDVDISFVANLTVKMFLEHFLKPIEPIFKYTSYMWSNRTGWDFDAPFQLKDIKFSKLSNCEVCSE